MFFLEVDCKWRLCYTLLLFVNLRFCVHSSQDGLKCNYLLIIGMTFTLGVAVRLKSKKFFELK